MHCAESIYWANGKPFRTQSDALAYAHECRLQKEEQAWLKSRKSISASQREQPFSKHSPLIFTVLMIAGFTSMNYFVVQVYPWDSFPRLLAIGPLLAQVTLIAAMAVLAPLRFAIRKVFALALGVLMWEVTYINLPSPYRGAGDVSCFLIALGIAAAAFPLALSRYFLGYRVLRPGQPDTDQQETASPIASLKRWSPAILNRWRAAGPEVLYLWGPVSICACILILFVMSHTVPILLSIMLSTIIGCGLACVTNVTILLSMQLGMASAVSYVPMAIALGVDALAILFCTMFTLKPAYFFLDLAAVRLIHVCLVFAAMRCYRALGFRLVKSSKGD